MTTSSICIVLSLKYILYHAGNVYQSDKGVSVI